MATIIEGAQYALTSASKKSPSHSVVFVKLTDSALKAIEDYAVAISSSSTSKGNAVKPLIDLRPNQNNSQGIITIPSKTSLNGGKISQQQGENDSGDENQSYNFSVKDIQNDGILECVKQTNSNMSMESLGRIMLKMQIHANDDIYQKTKVKMAVAAEQEYKKYNTKVINSTDVGGRKVKVKTGNSVGHHRPSAFGNSKFNNGNKSSNTATLSMPRFNKYSSTTNSSNNNSNNQQIQKNSSGFSSSNHHHHSSHNPQMDNVKKIREILTQLLTVPPKCSKLADLIVKVQERIGKEQQQQVDKNTIVNILNGIASFKEGGYHLNDTSTGGGGEDHAPDNGSALNKQLNIPNGNSNANSSISPFSDASGRSFSSPNSLNTSPSTNTGAVNKLSPYIQNGSNGNKSSSIKRNHAPSQDFINNSNINGNLKKFKNDNGRPVVAPVPAVINKPSAISSYSPFEKVNNNHHHHGNSSEHSPMGVSAPPGSKSTTSSFPNNNDGAAAFSNNKKPPGHDSQSCYVTNNHQPPHQRPYGSGGGSINSSPNSSPDSGIITSHMINNSSDSSFHNNNNNHDPDYLSKYTRIKDASQFMQYKSDFNAEFPEYKKLYDYVENVIRQFEEMKEKIQSKEEESDDWQDLIRQIFDRYDEVKNQTKFSLAKKRLNYLHSKLLHIKNLIHEYLNNNNNNNNNQPGSLDVKSCISSSSSSANNNNGTIIKSLGNGNSQLMKS